MKELAVKMKITIYGVNTVNPKHVGCHMAAGDPNDFIYCEVNWVAGDSNRIIFHGPLGSLDTKLF